MRCCCRNVEKSGADRDTFIEIMTNLEENFHICVLEKSTAIDQANRR
jgi:hypothetical protein